jgi:penicillin-binding protein 1A
MGLLRRSRSNTAAKSVRASAPSAARKKPLFKRLPWELRLLIVAAIYLGLPAAFLVGCAFAYFSAAIPDPIQLRRKESAPVVRVLARDGSLLGGRGGEGSYVPIDFLPPHLIDAVVATEDRRFFEHWGVDLAGVMRALVTNLRVGRLVQGGSTISQQLAKNLFLGPERTLTRKVGELVLALWLEFRLGKRDILELYLNRVYFGAGAYGVEAAAHRLFDKSAQALTLAEAAVLAGVLKAPSRFSPASNPVLARARARSVLAKMVEAGRLDPVRAEQVARGAFRFTALARQRQSGADYAVDAALERLPTLGVAGEEDLVIETSIDAGLQRKSQALVHDLMSGEARTVAASQAALIVLDLDGGIRALVGGRDYAESQFNRALKAKRQPGSAFKMFVYLAALERGLTPDSIVQDLPLIGTGWSPRNEGSGYHGAVPLREALAHSMNAATVRLHLSLGASRTVAAARRLGIRSELRPDASLALGTSEVTLLELTGAYGVIALGGRALEPFLIRRVRSASGKVLFERKPESGKLLVAPTVAGALTEMLSGVVSGGTGRRAALSEHAAAGKTGTSQEFRDAWFVGYTGQLIAGVWVGNDDGQPMRKVAGGTLPARLWHDVMTIAHEGLPVKGLAGTAPSARAGLSTPRAATPAAPGLLANPPAERLTPAFFARAHDGAEPTSAPPPFAQMVVR